MTRFFVVFAAFVEIGLEHGYPIGLEGVQRADKGN